MRLLSSLLILLYSFSSLADIPPPSSDPVVACEHRSEGSHCDFTEGGKFQVGRCQTVDGKLSCLPTKSAETGDDAHVHDKLATATNHAHDHDHDHDAVADDAQAAKETDPAVNTVNAQGCTNFAPLAGNLVSFLSVLFGLGLALRFRRR